MPMALFTPSILPLTIHQNLPKHFCHIWIFVVPNRQNHCIPTFFKNKMFGWGEFVVLDTPLYDSSYIVRNTYIAVFNTEFSAEPAYLVSSGIEKAASWKGVSYPSTLHPPHPPPPLRPGSYTAFNILHSVLEFKIKVLNR